MSQNVQQSLFQMIRLNEVVACIRRDFVAVLAAAVLLAGMGGVVGKLSNKTESSAQLVLSPMPLSGKGKVSYSAGRPNPDELESMLATPLDVKSTSLLCMSDEVLSKTLDQVNKDGVLSKPIKNLLQLKRTLSFAVAVQKETPYDITYTPLITLTAEAKNPADAKAMVNTWAHVVSDAAKRFQDAVQGPVAKALDGRKQELHDELTQTELDSEKFWTDNNPLYLETRLNEISGLLNTFRKEHATLEAEIVLDKGTVESLEADKTNIPEKIKLEWNLPTPLAASIASKLGIGTSKDGAAKQSGDTAITSEVLNPTYWEVVGKITSTRAGFFSKEKKIADLDRLIDTLEKERLDLQAQFAKATTGKLRVGRELIRIEEEFHDIALKQKFAQVASSLNHPALQILSEGAEWPVPRFQKAIAFGMMAGLLGFAAAACFSVLWRLFLKPALGG